MHTIPLFCGITAMVAAGCGRMSDGPTAAPYTVAWTLHTSGGSTSWSGLPTLPSCPLHANFQAYGDETATRPPSEIRFSSPTLLTDWPHPGSYQLSLSRANSIGVEVFVSTPETRYAPDDAAPGTITVDTYDADFNFITGTFQFASVANGAESQAGTVDGSFNFPCL